VNLELFFFFVSTRKQEKAQNLMETSKRHWDQIERVCFCGQIGNKLIINNMSAKDENPLKLKYP
jgi:hypothetical protein